MFVSIPVGFPQVNETYLDTPQTNTSQRYQSIPQTYVDTSQTETPKPTIVQSAPAMVETVKASTDTVDSTKGLSHVKRSVSSLEDAFDFFKHAMDEVCVEGEPLSSTLRDSLQLKLDTDFMPVEMLKDKLASLSMSTSYSGIGAPETTLHILKHVMGAKTGSEMPSPNILFQVEYDEACRNELALYDQICGADTTGSCIFGDMCDFFVDELQPVIKQLMEKPDIALEVLSRVVSSGEAVKTSAYCYKHQKTCNLILVLII